MGRKKNKKHSNQRTRTKRKEARIDNDGPHKSILGSAVSHALSSGWVQNSGVGFLFFLITLIVAIMTKTQVKAAALTFAMAGTVFLWIVAIAIVRHAEPDNPPFAAITPVPVLLNLRIVNRQEIPATISKFVIEIELAKRRSWIFPSKWLSAVFIPEQMPTIWVNPPPNPPGYIEFTGGRLEAVLRNRPLQPHETVSGWVLLDVPVEYDSTPRPLVFRISLKDTAGQSLIETLGPSDTNISTPYGFRITTAADISGRTIRHYADPPPN